MQHLVHICQQLSVYQQWCQNDVHYTPITVVKIMLDNLDVTDCRCKFWYIYTILQAMFFWMFHWLRAFRQIYKARPTCPWVVFQTLQLTASRKTWSLSACWSVSRRKTLQKNYLHSSMRTRNNCYILTILTGWPFHFLGKPGKVRGWE